MAYTITSACTACGLCLTECPIDAILAGDPIYVIDQELCCDFEDCLAVCPVNAIIPSDAVNAGADAQTPVSETEADRCA
jgi:ferredoxin